MTTPYAYPSAPHERQHGPTGYTDYRQFKPWLRDEFLFRCVYCLFRERWNPDGDAAFGVDHVLPKGRKRELSLVYDNLVYACNRCNTRKGTQNDVPSPDSVAYGEHLSVSDDGIVHPRTDVGARLCLTVSLNAPDKVAYRRRIAGLLKSHGDDLECRRLLRDWMGFPISLPDLRGLRPPTGNTRPEGVESSCFERRRRGELPGVY